MNDQTLTRRRLLALAPLQAAILPVALAADAPLNNVAGPDRVAVAPGKTYLRGWAGYGAPPAPRERRSRSAPPEAVAPAPGGPPIQVTWSRESGPGPVTFDDPHALATVARVARPGDYVLKLTASNGQASASSTLNLSVEPPPPEKELGLVYTKAYKVNNPLWNARFKSLVAGWIPYLIDQMNRSDIAIGAGGIDNFVEAAKKLRGEPHGKHKGLSWSNYWVFHTVESACIALNIDPQGDPELIRAQEKMRATLDDWIPKILSAQEPDGYFQTAYTLPREEDQGKFDSSTYQHWDPAHIEDHEGIVAGYFLEMAMRHHIMSGRKDARLYNAAKRLADCWWTNVGPPPKKPWYDGHQEMEQALVRFGRYVNEVDGAGKGRKYIELAKFLLDCRYSALPERWRLEYHQSHAPVVEQYEAKGHAVRALYTYSGMAHVAAETRDPDYQSAVRSQWNNIVHKKYYVTGGVGSGQTSEGFGPDYALRNSAYCESCSTVGVIFLQAKMNLIYHDARYADLYEDSLYNALLGSVDLKGTNFYYQNPLEERSIRYGWHACPCCVGNISRVLLSLPTWMYSTSPDSVFVNLYIGSTVKVENVAGTEVEMVQRTDYPWDGKVSLTVNPKTAKRFSVRLRAPNRNVSKLYTATPDAGGIASIAVNGKPVKAPIEKGYAVITQLWKPGDRIDLVLPLKVQRVRGIDKVEATRGRVALRYGPLLYNVERVDQDIDKVLRPGAALTTEFRKDLLGGVMVIKGQFADGSPMLAIPHYVRTNRESDAPLPYPERSQRDTPRPVKSTVWIREA